MFVLLAVVTVVKFNPKAQLTWGLTKPALANAKF